MALINTNTTPVTYPVSEYDFRAAYNNVSFPDPIPETELHTRGWYTLHDDAPEYDFTLHTIEKDGEPVCIDGAYTQRWKTAPRPLAEVRSAKFAEFDAIFTRLDTLKIRPAAAIAEALAAGEQPSPGDAYRLSELEAMTAENRELRAQVETAESVDAVRAVNVWWPGE